MHKRNRRVNMIMQNINLRRLYFTIKRNMIVKDVLPMQKEESKKNIVIIIKNNLKMQKENVGNVNKI